MRMASPVKANTYRVYLNDEMAGLMGKICESTELAQSDLLSKLVAAGLAAVKANNGRITLPLRFSITEAIEQDAPVAPIRRR